MARQSLQIVLAERPTRDIIPGQTFRQKVVEAPTKADLKDGELLVESIYLSLDPAMRGWLNDRRSYLPPVQIGEVMRGAAILRVIASKSSKANAGEFVTGFMGFQEVAILHETLIEDSFPLPPNAKLTDLIGVLGMTGMTAYFGMTTIGEPKAGETVVVSAAAGATGSVAAQIAKICGARVVGTAGSDEKCRWLKEELGLDVALNYKDPDFKQKFHEATPNYIDVFWDNGKGFLVGGEQLELALGRANKFARFVMCGGISQYNQEVMQGPKTFLSVVSMRIKMQGFIVFDFAKDYPQARRQIAQWLAEGKMKRKETIIKGGLGVSESALAHLFKGGNTGKLIVEVKNPEDSSKL
ncbi:hypothetical protein B0H63DRAFT_394799 [Podospora didyma]|uniref:Dehydrogenase FUB6 n=1 Tax=Podospora didyma TaxID=330526 RepID=A0AAE0NP02_9PEZI|nr:hypothetical protein B0H63DRAFT_394799 [Podospora didyma]